MKKIILIIMVLVLFASQVNAQFYKISRDTKQTTATLSDIKLYVDSKLVTNNILIIDNGINGERAYLQVRALCDTLGRGVNWDSNTREINIGAKTKVSNISPIKLKTPINAIATSITLCVNNEQISETVYIIEDRSYLPLRAISEELGLKVDWNGEMKEIYISEGI